MARPWPAFRCVPTGDASRRQYSGGLPPPALPLASRPAPALQASYLLGHVVSGVGGDLLLDYGRASLSSLLWVSAAAVTAAAATAVLCFPCLDVAVARGPAAGDTSLCQVRAGPPSHCALPLHRSSPSQPLARSPTRSLPSSTATARAQRAWERNAAGVRILARTASQPEAAVAASLWVVGYAAYQLVWGYETSLYSALAAGDGGGSTSWNGSVLGAALLAGTVAASVSGSRHTARLRTSMRACAQLLASGAVFSAATLLALYLAAVPLRAPAAALGAFIVYSALWQFQEVAFRVAIARRVEKVALEQPPNAVGLLQWLRGERDAPPQCVGEESRERLVSTGDEDPLGTRRAPFALAFSALVVVSLAVQTVLQWALFSSGGLSAAAAYGVLAAVLAVSTVVAAGLWVALSGWSHPQSAA